MVIGYIAKYGMKEPLKAAAYGNAVASYTVSGFGVEELVTMKHEDLLEKVEKITIS